MSQKFGSLAKYGEFREFLITALNLFTEDATVDDETLCALGDMLHITYMYDISAILSPLTDKSSDGVDKPNRVLSPPDVAAFRMSKGVGNGKTCCKTKHTPEGGTYTFQGAHHWTNTRLVRDESSKITKVSPPLIHELLSP